MTETLESKFAALISAKKALAIQNQDMAQQLAAHVVANRDLAVQNQDMTRQAAELVIANKELAIQNHAMTLQAAELVIANKELAVQAEQKALRAAELVIANKKLASEAEQKSRRAAELVIANAELAVQAEQKALRAAELVVANAELAIQAEEKELRAAELLVEKSRAEAASIAKSSFLANMSHEIRTPMNGIVGMASILRHEGVTPKQADHLDKIDIAAQHLLVIINNILDISKIEAGKFVLEEIPVAISSLLNNVGSILADRIKAKNLHLLIKTEPLPPNLIGDPTRLQQALLNCTMNAVKFTESGDVTLRIRKLEESANSVLVRFEVEDAGIGIPPDTVLRLFMPFEQADNSMTRKFGGTGLGLVITRRLAELMGGEAGVSSSLGVGSTFWFTARLIKGSAASITQATVHADVEAEIRQRYCGFRVLVVDDDEINREVAQIQLEAVDLVVHTANDGAEAVAMAQQTLYAAIFMDMQMPDVNGLEATKQIREIPEYRHTPIIAMTANAFSEDKARCYEAGMSDFLSKPFNPATLYATLYTSLSRQDV
ncbi:MAG: response regulator [Azonexus sp.]